MKENSHSELFDMMRGWCFQATHRDIQRFIGDSNDQSVAYDVKTFADIKSIYVSDSFYRELINDMRHSFSDFRLENGSATFFGVKVYHVSGNHPRCVIA